MIQMPERVLIVTDENLADENQVPEPIRPLIDHAEDIYVVAPTLTTRLQSPTGEIDRARTAADARLQTVFDHMHASGFDAHGTVGDERGVLLRPGRARGGAPGRLEHRPLSTQASTIVPTVSRNEVDAGRP
jgi:hypothetical protein